MPALLQSRLSHASVWLSWLVLFGGLATALVAGYLMFVAYTPVPFMDQWFVIHQIQLSHGGYSWTQLWEQHNEHRIVVPRLFYLADYFLFGAQNKFLLVAIYVTQCLHLLLFEYLLRHQPSTSLRTAVGVAAFCLFLPTQRENFVWGFQIAFLLPFLCATAGLTALSRYSQLCRPRWLVLAWLTACVASLSLASGFVLWPLFCFALYLLRSSWKAILWTAMLGAAALGIYSIGYRVPIHSDPLLAVHHPAAVLSFLLNLLGSSWSALYPAAGFVAASLSVCVYVAVLLYWSYRRRVPPLLVVLINVAGCGLLTATLTAFGRLNYGLAGRYQTPALIFWAGAGILLVLYSYAAPHWLSLVQVVLLSVMVVAATHFKSVRDELSQRVQTLALASTALAAGVNDPETLASFGMPSEFTLETAAILRRTHESFFHNPPAAYLGQAIFNHLQLRPRSRCEGAPFQVLPVADPQWPGARLTGSARDRLTEQPVTHIVIAINGIARGIGSAESAGPNAPLPGAWRAYLPASTPPGSASVYGLLDDGTSCQVGTEQSITTAEFSAPPLASASLSDFPDLVPLWLPGQEMPVVTGGEGQLRDGNLCVRASTNDVQVLFHTSAPMNRFSTLVFRAWFERQDAVELFFGRLVDGRSLSGYTPAAQRWLYVLANVAHNSYWAAESGSWFRFDPTGMAGMDSEVRINGLWGSAQSLPPNTPPFSFRFARDYK